MDLSFLIKMVLFFVIFYLLGKMSANSFKKAKAEKAVRWLSKRNFRVIEPDHLDQIGSAIVHELMIKLIDGLEEQKDQMVKLYMQQGVLVMTITHAIKQQAIGIPLAQALNVLHFNFMQVYSYRKSAEDCITESKMTAALQSSPSPYTDGNFLILSSLDDTVGMVNTIKNKSPRAILEADYVYLHVSMLIATPETNPYYMKQFMKE